MDKNLKQPLVSVLIATFNRADLIGEAIESVQRQTYENWELIVHDDASADGTESIVRGYAEKDSRIRYFRQERNVGISRNRNSGLAEARGIYIAILDSDDVWLDPRKLERQVAFLESHDDHALVGTRVATLDESGAPAGKFRYETEDASIRAKMLRRNQFTQSSVLMRASAVKEAGGYDPQKAINEDYDLWLKLGAAKAGPNRLANIPEYMTGYRIHPGGITKVRQIRAAEEHLAIIRKRSGSYPGYPLALLKGYLRVLKALMGI